MYFKHAARSPFFYSKCLLFHNATFFLVPVLFTFYIQVVLKFKCKTPLPKVNVHRPRYINAICNNKTVRPYATHLL
jgi:hypothetical protein